MNTPTNYKYLVRKPKSSYKQLFVKDRWVSARTLYGQSVGDEARTPEELAEDYNLPLEVVREAIAYCESDPLEIREDFEIEEALVEASGMNDPDYKYHLKARDLSPQERAKIVRSIEAKYEELRKLQQLGTSAKNALSDAGEHEALSG